MQWLEQYYDVAPRVGTLLGVTNVSTFSFTRSTPYVPHIHAMLVIKVTSSCIKVHISLLCLRNMPMRRYVVVFSLREVNIFGRAVLGIACGVVCVRPKSCWGLPYGYDPWSATLLRYSSSTICSALYFSSTAGWSMSEGGHLWREVPCLFAAFPF